MARGAGGVSGGLSGDFWAQIEALRTYVNEVGEMARVVQKAARAFNELGASDVGGNLPKSLREISNALQETIRSGEYTTDTFLKLEKVISRLNKQSLSPTAKPSTKNRNEEILKTIGANISPAEIKKAAKYNAQQVQKFNQEVQKQARTVSPARGERAATYAGVELAGKTKGTQRIDRLAKRTLKTDPARLKGKLGQGPVMQAAAKNLEKLENNMLGIARAGGYTGDILEQYDAKTGAVLQRIFDVDRQHVVEFAKTQRATAARFGMQKPSYRLIREAMFEDQDTLKNMTGGGDVDRLWAKGQATPEQKEHIDAIRGAQERSQKTSTIKENTQLAKANKDRMREAQKQTEDEMKQREDYDKLTKGQRSKLLRQGMKKRLRGRVTGGMGVTPYEGQISAGIVDDVKIGDEIRGPLPAHAGNTATSIFQRTREDVMPGLNSPLEGVKGASKWELMQGQRGWSDEKKKQWRSYATESPEMGEYLQRRRAQGRLSGLRAAEEQMGVTMPLPRPEMQPTKTDVGFLAKAKERKAALGYEPTEEQAKNNQKIAASVGNAKIAENGLLEAQKKVLEIEKRTLDVAERYEQSKRRIAIAQRVLNVAPSRERVSRMMEAHSAEQAAIAGTQMQYGLPEQQQQGEKRKKFYEKQQKAWKKQAEQTQEWQAKANETITKETGVQAAHPGAKKKLARAKRNAEQQTKRELTKQRQAAKELREATTEQVEYDAGIDPKTGKKVKATGMMRSSDSRRARLARQEELNAQPTQAGGKGLSRFWYGTPTSYKDDETGKYKVKRTGGARDALFGGARGGGGGGGGKAGYIGDENYAGARSLSGAFQIAAPRIIAYGALGTAVWKAKEAMNEFVDTLKDTETKIVELRKVMNPIATDFDSMSTQMFQSAKDFGRSYQEVGDAMIDFARQGKDAQEVVELSRISMLAANVASVSGADATKMITTALHQFNISASNSIDIVDKYNNVSNKNAVTMQNLGEAVTQTGAAYKSAGGNIDELIGLTTALSQATQYSGSRIGRGLRFMSARFRMPAAKEQFSQAGIETVTDTGEYKSMYNILDELSKKWYEIGTAQQFALARSVGGTRYYSEMITLMNNFDIASKAMNESIGSQGSAMEENEKYMDSWEGRLNVLKATFYETLESAGTKSGFLDLLKKITEQLKELSSNQAIYGFFNFIRTIISLITSETGKMLGKIALIAGAFKVLGGAAAGQGALQTGAKGFVQGGLFHLGQTMGMGQSPHMTTQQGADYTGMRKHQFEALGPGQQQWALFKTGLAGLGTQLVTNIAAFAALAAISWGLTKAFKLISGGYAADARKKEVDSINASIDAHEKIITVIRDYTDTMEKYAARIDSGKLTQAETASVSLANSQMETELGELLAKQPEQLTVKQYLRQFGIDRDSLSATDLAKELDNAITGMRAKEAIGRQGNLKRKSDIMDSSYKNYTEGAFGGVRRDIGTDKFSGLKTGQEWWATQAGTGQYNIGGEGYIKRLEEMEKMLKGEGSKYVKKNAEGVVDDDFKTLQEILAATDALYKRKAELLAEDAYGHPLVSSKDMEEIDRLIGEVNALAISKSKTLMQETAKDYTAYVKSLMADDKTLTQEKAEQMTRKKFMEAGGAYADMQKNNALAEELNSIIEKELGLRDGLSLKARDMAVSLEKINELIEEATHQYELQLSIIDKVAAAQEALSSIYLSGQADTIRDVMKLNQMRYGQEASLLSNIQAKYQDLQNSSDELLGGGSIDNPAEGSYLAKAIANMKAAGESLGKAKEGTEEYKFRKNRYEALQQEVGDLQDQARKEQEESRKMEKQMNGMYAKMQGYIKEIKEGINDMSEAEMNLVGASQYVVSAFENIRKSGMDAFKEWASAFDSIYASMIKLNLAQSLKEMKGFREEMKSLSLDIANQGVSAAEKNLDKSVSNYAAARRSLGILYRKREYLTSVNPENAEQKRIEYMEQAKDLEKDLSKDNADNLSEQERLQKQAQLSKIMQEVAYIDAVKTGISEVDESMKQMNNNINSAAAAVMDAQITYVRARLQKELSVVRQDVASFINELPSIMLEMKLSSAFDQSISSAEKAIGEKFDYRLFEGVKSPWGHNEDIMKKQVEDQKKALSTIGDQIVKTTMAYKELLAARENAPGMFKDAGGDKALAGIEADLKSLYMIYEQNFAGLRNLMVSQFRQSVVNKLRDSITQAFKEAATTSVEAFTEKFKQELSRIGDDLFSMSLFGDATPEESQASFLNIELERLIDSIAKAKGEVRVLEEINKNLGDTEISKAIAETTKQIESLQAAFDDLKAKATFAKIVAEIKGVAKSFVGTLIEISSQDIARKMTDDMQILAQAFAKIPRTSDQYIDIVQTTLARQENIISGVASGIYDAYAKIATITYKLNELDRLGLSNTMDALQLRGELARVTQDLAEQTSMLAAAEKNRSDLKMASGFTDLGKTIQSDMISAMVGNTGWNTIEKNATDAFKQSVENAFKMAGPDMQTLLMNIMYGVVSSENIGNYMKDKQFSDIEKQVATLVATIHGNLGGFGADVDRFTELAINLPSRFSDVMPSVVELQKAAGQFLNMEGLSPIEENSERLKGLTDALDRFGAVIGSANVIGVDIETARAHDRLIGTMNNLTGAIQSLNNNISGKAGKQFYPSNDFPNPTTVPNDVTPSSSTGARSINPIARNRVKIRKQG